MKNAARAQSFVWTKTAAQKKIRRKFATNKNRFETQQEKTEKVHQATNMKISSMRTSRQQRNAFQQNSKLNIESHGKL